MHLPYEYWDKILGFGEVLKQYQFFLKILGLDIFWIINGGERDLGIQEILPKKIESHLLVEGLVHSTLVE
jgi:hypothetical protein